MDSIELEKGLNCSNCSNALRTLRDQITNFNNKLLANEQKFLDLHSDVKPLTVICQNADQLLRSTCNTLTNLSDDLAQLYHLVCNGTTTVNGETPSRVFLDLKNDDNDSPSATQSQFKSDILLQCGHISENNQVKHLKTAVERTIVLNETGSFNNGGNSSIDDNSEKIIELQEQIDILKELLLTKCKEIATLRTVRKLDEETAEVKSKHKCEKLVATKTISDLRNEIDDLKEDIAIHSGLRATLEARCEQYVARYYDLNRKYEEANEQIRTFNQLVRLALQQKLELQHKIEQYEKDRKQKT